MKLLAPSILSADFWRLGEQIRECIEGGADIIHFDVMDGHFVPNITFGPVLLESIKNHCPLPLDAHLMIENPDKYIPGNRRQSITYKVNFSALSCKEFKPYHG